MALTHDVALYGQNVRIRLDTHDLASGPPSDDPRDPQAHCSSESPTAFAALFDALVRERGLSNGKLAMLTPFDQSFFSRLRNGSRNPSGAAILAIAEALRLTSMERDRLLLAAGLWPWSLPDDATLTVIRRIMEVMSE